MEEIDDISSEDAARQMQLLAGYIADWNMQTGNLGPICFAQLAVLFACHETPEAKGPIIEYLLDDGDIN